MLRIVRTTPKDKPQIGMLSHNGIPICLTLELPNIDNQPSVSCIPTGIHKCVRVYDRILPNGIKIQSTYEVKVDGRSGILFHSGNTVSDTRGCILVGLGFSGHIGLGYMIRDSRLAFKKLLEVVRGEEIDLEIVSVV